jgi:hypothetical protein
MPPAPGASTARTWTGDVTRDSGAGRWMRMAACGISGRGVSVIVGGGENIVFVGVWAIIEDKDLVCVESGGIERSDVGEDVTWLRLDSVVLGSVSVGFELAVAAFCVWLWLGVSVGISSIGLFVGALLTKGLHAPRRSMHNSIQIFDLIFW